MFYTEKRADPDSEWERLGGPFTENSRLRKTAEIKAVNQQLGWDQFRIREFDMPEPKESQS